MAICPHCKGEMNVTEAICPHCGYDFPSEDADFDQNGKRKRRGIAYSTLADIALMIGMACTALSAIVTLLVMGLALLGLNWRLAFSSCIGFFILLALYVVFQRVSDME